MKNSRSQKWKTNPRDKTEIRKEKPKLLISLRSNGSSERARCGRISRGFFFRNVHHHQGGSGTRYSWGLSSLELLARNDEYTNRERDWPRARSRRHSERKQDFPSATLSLSCRCLGARTLSLYQKSDFAAKAAYRRDRSVYACTYQINFIECVYRVYLLSLSLVADVSLGETGTDFSYGKSWREAQMWYRITNM